MASGYRHFAGLKGTKLIYVGADPTAYDYTDFATAYAAAQHGDVVYLESGTYSLSTAITFNKALTVIGLGRVIINGGTAGLNSALLSINVPATYSTDFRVSFENIIFQNAYAAAAVIGVNNNGGGAQDIYLDFKDCTIDAESTSTTALSVAQATNTKDIFIRVISSKYDICDASTIALTKAGSSVTFINMDVGVLALGTTNVASIINMYRCLYASAAQTSGGSASLIFNSWDSVKKNSGAIAAQALADFDATSASENCTTNTLLT